MENITAALRRLNLSEHEQAIYLSLLKDGKTTARILAARTGITRPSVYDQLKSLIALGLVVELDIEGKAQFAAADLKFLDALLVDKIDRLEQSREFLAEALPAFAGSLQTVTPKIRFFEGGEGMKSLLKDVMWHDSLTISMIWPFNSMAELFDPAFLNWFDERRLVRKLKINLLIPKGHEPKRHSLLLTNGPQDEMRILNHKESIGSASLIYDNKTAFISSGHEAFGFIVESSEFASLQALQFTSLWNSSKKYS